MLFWFVVSCLRTRLGAQRARRKYVFQFSCHFSFISWLIHFLLLRTNSPRVYCVMLVFCPAFYNKKNLYTIYNKTKLKYISIFKKKKHFTRSKQYISLLSGILLFVCFFIYISTHTHKLTSRTISITRNSLYTLDFILFMSKKNEI